MRGGSKKGDKRLDENVLKVKKIVITTTYKKYKYETNKNTIKKLPHETVTFT